MPGLTTESLEKHYQGAIDQGAAYAGIAVTIPGGDGTEIIINRASNLVNKLAYYKSVYDENLVHKHSPEIKIVAISHGDDLAFVAQSLIEAY